ncbi:MAG TPA: substrate-binding domain-containing protein [Candidatus Lustribacter sp.]|nr:substrate-binding domain-containing protein [Candidatus Lustribacter sp.]
MKARVLFLLVLLAAAPAAAQTPAHVTLFAAGSLHEAFTDIAKAFTQQTGIVVDQTYGSSGLLRGRIERGERPDVFASADTANPEALQRLGESGAVTVFTRNSMCLLAKPAAIGSRAPAAIMLDPAVRLVTSTPKADPAGDYAEAIFAKIEAQRPGSLAILDAKALRLIGGTDAVNIPAGNDIGVYLLLTANRGDALLAYCSGMGASAKASSGRLRAIEMPPDLAVGANYGLSLRDGAPPDATYLRAFILSPAGQTILERYGFSPV